MNTFLIIVLAYIILGCVVLLLMTSRIAKYEFFILEDYSNPVSRSLMYIMLWPNTLYKFTRKDLVKQIRLARHKKYPWRYDENDKVYPEDEQETRLVAQVRAERNKEVSSNE